LDMIVRCKKKQYMHEKESYKSRSTQSFMTWNNTQDMKVDVSRKAHPM